MTDELSLLYIEDDPEILENVSFLLSKFVKDVYIASDGEEALKKYKEHLPDIVITDINIPKINGLDVARQIRDVNGHVPIMIISAYNEERQIQQAKKIGVSTYLKKPFTLQELKEAIAKAIEESTK